MAEARRARFLRLRSQRGVLALITVVLGVFGCAGGITDTERANDALQAGLRAHRAGDLAEAQRLYREVIELDPRNKFGYFNLGLVHQMQDRPKEAETLYRIAVGIDRTFVPALYNLAILRAVAPGGSREAIELYRRVIELEPRNAIAHLNLGVALRAAGNRNESDREIQIARALDPTLIDPAAPNAQPSSPAAASP